MEYNSLFKMQLRKKLTTRAVMDKRIEMLEADIDKNNEKIDDTTR